MAMNYFSKDDAVNFNLGAGVTAGEPVIIGQIPGVALENTDVNGNAAVALEGIWYLQVKGYVAGTATALTAGQRVYLSANGAILDGTTTNTYFGKILDPVASGVTVTVRVLLGEY